MIVSLVEVHQYAVGVHRFMTNGKFKYIQWIQEQIYSIEHIMPQTLNKEWINELGKNYQEVPDLYLNSIGNLTVIAYNSQ